MSKRPHTSGAQRILMRHKLQILRERNRNRRRRTIKIRGRWGEHTPRIYVLSGQSGFQWSADGTSDKTENYCCEEGGDVVDSRDNDALNVLGLAEIRVSPRDSVRKTKKRVDKRVRAY